MPEKEPQFFRREPVGEGLGQRAEIKEKPIDRLKREIKDIASELQKEGVPVDSDNRIDLKQFVGVYSRQEIGQDEMWVENLDEAWKRSAVSSHGMAWLLGREQTKKQVAERNPMGNTWEMLATKILHENLGKRFIVARTSKYDDARYKVDNIFLDRETGKIVCAFDQVASSEGKKVFEEKRAKVLERNWQRGGADLKYGIFLEEESGKKKLKKGRVSQIPLFYFALSEEQIKEVLKDPGQEKNIFRDFVDSAKKQIKEIERGPVHEELKKRLDFFKEVLEKL